MVLTSSLPPPPPVNSAIVEHVAAPTSHNDFSTFEFSSAEGRSDKATNSTVSLKAVGEAIESAREYLLKTARAKITIKSSKVEREFMNALRASLEIPAGDVSLLHISRLDNIMVRVEGEHSTSEAIGRSLTLLDSHGVVRGKVEFCFTKINGKLQKGQSIFLAERR